MSEVNLNPLNLQLKVVATCDTLEDAHDEAAIHFTCVVAALAKTNEGKLYLRPEISQDTNIFAYIVIQC